MFDAKQFMNSTVSAPMATEREQVPEGQYRFMVDAGEGAIEFRSGTIGKGERAGEPWVSASIRCLCLDENIKAQLGRDKVLVYKSIFLDLDAQGGLDTGKGKNVELGQLREAVNQNGSGPWNFSMLEGAGPFIGEVKHRMNDDKAYPEIRAVARIS